MRSSGESVILGSMDSATDTGASPYLLHLSQLLLAEPLQHVLLVDVGDATLERVVQLLQGRQTTVYLLESAPRRFAERQAAYAAVGWLHGLRAYPIEPVRVPDPEAVLAFYRQPGNALRRMTQNEVLERLAYEHTMYERHGAPASLGGIDAIRRRYGVVDFDLAVIEGPEFLAHGIVQKLQGSRRLAMTGTRSFAHAADYERLMQVEDLRLLQESTHWRSGFAIFVAKTPTRPGVSAIVHARNAARLLPDCLDSLAWADERIVVEMDSDDDTAAVAAAHGARVVRHLPTVCVDEARNWGQSQARFDWTLVVDADERIPLALAERVQELIRRPDAVTGYWLARRNFFFGQEVGYLYPDFQLRLFRSQSAYWRGVVHELPMLRGTAERFPEDRELAIVHYSYADVADFVQRQLRYADILWRQKGQYPTQALPNLAHELRKRYEMHQAGLSEQLGLHTPNHLEWLVRNLYLFSDLSMTATLLQNSGQLTGVNSARRPKLSAYSYVKNAQRFDYPLIESLLSVITVCDEVVVGYAVDSDDQTLALLEELARGHAQLRLFPSRVWEEQRLGGETIRLAAEEAMAQCSGDWLWHVQADEVYTRADAAEVRKLVDMYDNQPVHAFRFGVLHFYGAYDVLLSPQAQEVGWYQHTIRLARAGHGRHFGDAWTLSLPETDAVVTVPVRIFHYGHVRELEAMRIKSNYMERLYHALPDDFSVAAAGAFRYDRVPVAYHLPYLEAHPESMQLRIAQTRLRGIENLAPKPRLLIVSRFHRVKKGFGITLNEIYATGVLQAHFEVQQLAWHYDDGPQEIDGVHIWPCPEAQKLQALRERLYHFLPDVILLHADAHFFVSYLPELQSWRGPVVGWFTVDYERPGNPSAMLPLFRRCQRLLSMADFSLQQLRKDFNGPLGKVPLGVNRQVFHPIDAEARRTLRQKLAWRTDAFVFLIVANNFWRKGLEYAVVGFSRLLQDHPELAANTVMYFHTERSPMLDELIQAYRLSQHILFSPDYDPYRQPLDDMALAELYQAADAFVLPTLGEGFGMPVLEAQAVGLPLIVSDNSVLREVARDAALYIRCPGLVGGQNADSHVWMRCPDTEHLAERLYQLRTDPGLRQRLGQAGYAQAQEMSWLRTATLLGAELASEVDTGKLEYLPPEPGWRAV